MLGAWTLSLGRGWRGVSPSFPSSHTAICTGSPNTERTLHPHLESHGVGDSQKYPQRQLGLVGPVAPQAVGTSCHTQSGQEEAEVGCKTQAGKTSAMVPELSNTPHVFSLLNRDTREMVSGRNLRHEESTTWEEAAFLICSIPVPRISRELSSANFDLWIFFPTANLLFANVSCQSWCKVTTMSMYIRNSISHVHSQQGGDWALRHLLIGTH